MDKALDDFLKVRDTSGFKLEPYVKRVEKPWGYELHFTNDNEPYMAKILHMDKGKRLSLQIHDQKQETWYLLEGEVIIVIENKNGEMEEIKMQPGVGYTTKIGQKHRLVGGDVESEDSKYGNGGTVFEASMPEVGNTFRLEDDYARSTETEETRKDPNRGWNS